MRSSWDVVMVNMLSFLSVEQAKESRYVGKGKTLVSIALRPFRVLFGPITC